MLQRRWWASSGNGAWTGRSLLKATRCQVSDVRRLEDASLSYSSLHGWDERGRLDDFLSLGLVALSYGTALMLKGYGFLAVFAAGVALRHLVERQSSKPAESKQAVEQALTGGDASAAEQVAVHRDHAP